MLLCLPQALQAVHIGSGRPTGEAAVGASCSTDGLAGVDEQGGMEGS